MPDASCTAATRSLDNLQACGATALAAGAALWGHMASSFGEWAPVVLWALSAGVAISTIWRNIAAVRSGKP